MAKTFNTAIYNESDPIGVDFELCSIQRKLARITWMESIFGRAKTQYRLKSDNQSVNNIQQDEGFRGDEKFKIYFPQGRKLDGDIDLSPDDSYASRCFFFSRDPINANPKTDSQDWTSYNVELGQPLTMIFTGNANKLEISSTEVLKNCILYELNNCPNIIIGNLYENVDNIWKEWTLTQQIQSFTKYPYYSLRVDFIMTYVAFPYNGRTDILDPIIYDNENGEDIEINSIIGNPNNN